MSYFGNVAYAEMIRAGLGVAVGVSSRNLYSGLYNQADLVDALSQNWIAALGIGAMLGETLKNAYSLGASLPSAIGNAATALAGEIFWKLKMQRTTQLTTALAVIMVVLSYF